MNFEKFENAMSKLIMPLASKANNNKMLSAVAEGFMRTTPITLGVAVFAIIGNLPITGWSEWLVEVGLKSHFDAALGASTNFIGIYVAFSIAYAYAKKNEQNAITAGFISLASFLIMMPQSLTVGEETIGAVSIGFISSNGLVIALITALLTSCLYVKLVKKGIVFKMPSSVPSMVSESLSPVFVAIIIFSCAFAVRVGFSYTSYGNAFDFIQDIVTTPLLAIGGSIPALILFYSLANLLWFFGIHPTIIYGPITPITTTMVLSNIDAMQSGAELPYVTSMVVLGVLYLGSTGNTLGLLMNMLFAKSERYKAMFKISIIPNIFNINEPVIFGTPLMLNPVFFIPMVFSCSLMALTAIVMCNIVPFTINPLMALLPWTTPFFLNGFFSGGISLLIIYLTCFAVNTLVYLPFFKIADKQALKEERDEATKGLDAQQV